MEHDAMKPERLAATYAEFIAERMEYDALFERAQDAIFRDVLDGLNNGSITADQLFDEMEEDQ